MVFECDALRAGDREREPVDPPRLVRSAVLAEPGAGELFDAVQLLAVDGPERSAVSPGAAGLDLAEDDRVSSAGDQVEFAALVAPVAGEDLHPVSLEVRGRQPFADPAELMRAELAKVRRCSSRTRTRTRTRTRRRWRWRWRSWGGRGSSGCSG